MRLTMRIDDFSDFREFLPAATAAPSAGASRLLPGIGGGGAGVGASSTGKVALKERQKEERVMKLERGIMFETAQNSAGSYNLSIQKCAAPAVAAMAVSG